MMKKFVFSLGSLLLAVVLAGQETDCYGKFFKQGTAVKNTKAITVTAEKRPQKLSGFIAANFIASDEKIALIDVDKDGSKELVLRNYTGGAHCCDELYIFKNTATNKYSLAVKLFAGNVCVNDSVFVFDVHESFGYFFTCFACGLNADGEQKHKALVAVNSVNLWYRAGKMEAVPGSETLKQTILKNLQYLKKLRWDGGVKEGEFDDGRRKEYALNLAVYYFSFGLNLPETKKLFDAHYVFRDAAAVWKEFTTLLKNVKTNMGL